jgi:DNA-binding CsgD family transcriptional regulator
MARKEGYRWRRGARQPNERQREVLDLLLEGKSNAEIAVRLGITVDGAKWHVGELLAETACADRQALASWWRRERGRKPGWALLPWLRLGSVAKGVLAASAGLVAVAVGLAMLIGAWDRDPEAADAGKASPTSTPWQPTQWPEEALETLAAQQGPPPPTCEPPQSQDLRLVDASELAAQGLKPAGRVLVAGHCPLYVANRADRSLVWLAGGGLLRLAQADGWRLVQWYPAGYYASVLDDEYYLTAHNAPSPGAGPSLADAFNFIDSSTTGVRPVFNDGTYLMMRVRGATPTPGRADHRVAFSSDGQMFIDPAPLSGDVILNGLTGEEIDVNRGPSPELQVRAANVATASLRTDCWEEHGVCNVYLDGVRGAREGDTGVFNPPVMLAPFDGVLSCVADEKGAWNIDGPALAYELSNGPLRLRFGGLGGYAEEHEDCQPRDVRRGQEIEVWTYTYIEAFVSGEPVSAVSTRDGRLFVGEVELELDCPCEMRK